MESIPLKAFPERHIDCGIAESNMMGIAAGMAATGKIPFVSSFARNCQTPKAQVYRAVVLCSRSYRRLCLYVIRRIHYYHTRDRAHQGNVLITLVGSSVLRRSFWQKKELRLR